MGAKMIQASDVTVGMELAEADGYLFTVKAIEERGATRVLVLTSVGAGLTYPMDGLRIEVRGSDLVRAVVADSEEGDAEEQDDTDPDFAECDELAELDDRPEWLEVEYLD